MTHQIRIYLLDDDPVFLRAVQRALDAKLAGRQYVLFTFGQGEPLLKELEAPDLLITDIDLGSTGLSGLEVARAVREGYPQCAIMFLTAYLSFATEIYEVGPLYFILKEEYEDRISKALELFFSRREGQQEHLSLSVGRERLAIPLQDIHYCERMGKKTRVVLSQGEILVNNTIDDLMSKLPETRFAICHKGYLVALSQVVSHSRNQAILRSGAVLPISRARQEEFRSAFSRFLSHPF